MEKNITTNAVNTNVVEKAAEKAKDKAGDKLITRATAAVEKLGYKAINMNYGQYIKVEKDGKKLLSVYRRSDGLRIVDMPTTVFAEMPETYTGKLDANGQFTGAMLVKKPVIAGKYTAHYIDEKHIEKALEMALKAVEKYNAEAAKAKAEKEKAAKEKAKAAKTEKAAADTTKASTKTKAATK